MSWSEFQKRQKEETELKEVKETELTEMCDCCGYSYINIKRASFTSKRGIRFVIRYCPNCNPINYWNYLAKLLNE